MAVQYAAIDDFVRAFGQDEAVQLSNLDDPTADQVDEAYLLQALEDATEEANSYLRSRYLTPIGDPPRALVRWVLDIARYLLHRYDPPETTRRNYEDALRCLREVRDGKKALDLGAITQTATYSVGAPEVFSMDAADEPQPFGDLRGFSGGY